MADLLIDTDELRMRASALNQTCALLKGVRGNAEVIAGAVGHQGLAGKVREFGGSWDVTREKLGEQLEGLSRLLTAIADTYEDLDQDLASAANGKGTK